MFFISFAFVDIFENVFFPVFFLFFLLISVVLCWKALSSRGKCIHRVKVKKKKVCFINVRFFFVLYIYFFKTFQFKTSPSRRLSSYLYKGFPPDDGFLFFHLPFRRRASSGRFWCLNHNTMYARSSIVNSLAPVFSPTPAPRPVDEEDTAIFRDRTGKPSLSPPPMSHGNQATAPRIAVTVTVLTVNIISHSCK